MFWLAFTIWAYEIINIFFFSIDYNIIEKNIPIISFLIEYKILFFIILFSTIVLKSGKEGVLKFLLNLFGFPFLLIWKIMKLVHKNDWYFFVFSLITGVFSFIDGFKYRMINITLFFISISVFFFGNNKFFAYISIFSSFLFLILSYLRAIIDSIRTPYFYRVVKKIISFWTPRAENLVEICQDEEDSKDIIVINSTRLKQSSFSSALFTSSIYSFIHSAMEKYKNKNVMFIYCVLIFTYLLFCNIFSVSIMNYSLWIIDSHEFGVEGNVGIFDFIFYSCREMVFADVDNLKAVMKCAKSFQLIDNFTSVYLLVVIVIALFTNKNDKFLKENEQISRELELGKEIINKKICKLCNTSDFDIIKSELMKANESIYRIYVFFTKKT